MSRQPPLLGLMAMVVLAALAGCQPQQPFYLKHVDCDLAHYKGVATEIEYPDVDADTAGRRRPTPSGRSRWSTTTRRTSVWDLTLEEAMQIALKNNKVMQSTRRRRFKGAPTSCSAASPTRNSIPTIYDPALAESDPRSGTEAALSAFDAQFSQQPDVGTDEHAAEHQSGIYECGIFADVSEHDIGKFQAQLSKVAATGGQFSLTHTVAYDKDRFLYPSTATPPYAYPSDWNVNLQAELRQPLLQGAGVAVQPHCRAGGTAGPIQRRSDCADQHRHRPGRLRGQRAEPGQRRGNGLLGAVLPVPEPRRGDRRTRQRTVDVAEDLHPLPHRRQGRRGRERGPGPRAVLSLPQQRRTVAQLRCTPPKPSSATCWDWRPPTAG